MHFYHARHTRIVATRPENCRKNFPGCEHGGNWAIIRASFVNADSEMLFFVDFAPLALFLGAFMYTKDLKVAIAALMITMPISLAAKYKLTGKLDKMLFWSTVFALVLGAATLILDDKRFFYWKPTALYWVLAVVFFASNWIGKKPLVERFFDLLGELPTQHVSDAQIRTLNNIWGLFFVAVGIANLYVAFNFSEAFWVNFKVFGLTALTFIFVSAQVFWIVSKMDPEADANDKESP